MAVSAENILIVADSEHDANMLYAVGMFVPDPFIYLRSRGRCQVVLNEVEIDRARRQASHCQIISLHDCQAKLRRAGRPPTLAGVVGFILHRQRIRCVTVPETFPLALARQLEGRGIRVRTKAGLIFPSREFKTPQEVKKISAALIMAEVGLAEGIQALKLAKVGRNRRLFYHNVPLTSEKLRAIIGTVISQAGGLANHTIVAGGRQACNPREQGHGVLRANEPIVIDISPRSQQTGYFGDITRTVVKGRANEAVRKLYHVVQKAQNLGLRLLRREGRGDQIHRSIRDFFDQEGYKTGRKNGQLQGFFHGTGRGLGLEVHEAPRLDEGSNDTLHPGHVVTMEPGLYYPEIGAVRLEDVALVTRSAPRNLTKFEKTLEV